VCWRQTRTPMMRRCLWPAAACRRLLDAPSVGTGMHGQPLSLIGGAARRRHGMPAGCFCTPLVEGSTPSCCRFLSLRFAHTHARNPTREGRLFPWQVRDILSNDGYALQDNNLVIRGWVRTVRQQKQHAFIELSDGSHPTPLQIVVTPELAQGMSTGCSVEVEGKVVASPSGEQKVELVASRVSIIGSCDPEKYPLAKKRHSLEFLREIPHLRVRSNTIGGMLRVRDTAASAIRDFFHQNGFVELHTPILTSSDCEGAGEQFTVSALLPPSEDRKGDADRREFFDRTVGLTVSGQLQAEMAACALSRVYTFGPTFRADNSMTRNHLAEFWWDPSPTSLMSRVAWQAEASIRADLMLHAIDQDG